MKLLKRFYCYLFGHRRAYYQHKGIYYVRCERCKQELDTRHDINPFGW